MNNDTPDDIMKDFILDCYESLDQADLHLVRWENGQSGSESVHQVFRSIHSIKGASGSLGLTPMESLAHAGEHMLSLMRDGKVKPHRTIISVLLDLSDGLRRMLQSLEKTGHLGGEDFSALISSFQELAQIKNVNLTLTPV